VGKLRRLEREQRFAADAETIWDFIAAPGNLQRITPPNMKFHVLTPLAKAGMHAGQIIEYRVRPLFGIGLRWVTEITHVHPGKYFVDEQRFGPYAFWHHQHMLDEANGQTTMTDLVHYKLPFGVAGALANGLVAKRLNDIFDYRQRVLKELFG
jgi:ligand-binding SRPBCC domain-containing protein